MSQNELQRVEFERWLVRRWNCSTEKWADSGEYKYSDTRNWWECWKAGTEAAQAVAPGGWDEAMAAARAAVYGSDGRGMIGADRRHLVERVARVIQGVGDSDGLYLKCYGSLAKAVASAGFCINCKDGDIYLTPLAAAPASEAKGAAIGEWWCERNCDCVGECKAGIESKPAASSAAGEPEPPLMKCICTDPGAGCTNKCDRGQIPPLPAKTYTIPASPTIEQEQAGELPELPEPCRATQCDSTMRYTTHDFYTADQMHEYARTAILRRAARVEVTDAMVERAAGAFVDHPRGQRMVVHSAMRAALTAALEPKE